MSNGSPVIHAPSILKTLNLVDDLTQTSGQPNRESIGQGVANTVTGLFGGMGEGDIRNMKSRKTPFN
jgi:MFS superfamily sulfate permease-like transporter